MTEAPFREVTVTVLVAVPKLDVVAVIVAEPAATPVTGTGTPPEFPK
jgi:hypothetical protein